MSTVRFFTIWVLLGFLLTGGVELRAQTDVSHIGKEFWVGIGNRSTTSLLRMFIRNQNEGVNTIRIVTADTFIQHQVNPGGWLRVNLNAGQYSTTNAAQIQNRGIQVVGDKNFTLMVAGEREAFSDATIVFPKTYLGATPKYLLNRYTQTFDNNTLVLVAMEDSTELIIDNAPVGYASSIWLNRFETYPVPYLHNNATMGIRCGKYCKPFAVYYHNSSTQIGGCNALEPLYCQMLPEDKWGLDFTYAPPANQSAGYGYSIMASENNTTVVINGGDTTFVLNRGQRFQSEALSDQVICVRGNKPLSCFQLLKGRDCQQTRLGDPALVELMANEKGMNTFHFRTMDGTGIVEHYMSVVVKDSFKNSLRINNMLVGAGEFMSSKCHDYAIFRRKIDSGAYQITCNVPVVGYVYGYGNGESYQYALGQTGISFNYDFELQQRGVCPGDSIYVSKTGDALINVRFEVGRNVLAADSGFLEVAAPGTQRVRMRANPPDQDCEILMEKEIFVQGPERVFPNDTAICGSFQIPVYLPVQSLSSWEWLIDSMPNYQGDSLIIERSGRYSIRLTDTFLCTFTDSIIVLQSELPRIQILAPAYVCEGEDVLLQNMDRNPQITYTLVGDGFLTEIEDSLRVVRPDTGTYTFKVRGMLEESCGDSIDIGYRVIPMPKADFSMSPPGMCFRNHAFQITDLSMGFGYGLTASWDLDGWGTGLPQLPPTVFFSAPGTFRASLYLENDWGCSDHSDTFSVQVWPQAQLSAQSDTVCMGENNTFRGFAVVPSGSISEVLWRFADNTTAASPVHVRQFPAPGFYSADWISMTDNGCRDTLLLAATAGVLPLPVTQFTLQKITDSMDVSLYAFRFTGTGTEPLSFSWTFDRFGSSNERNPVGMYYDTGSLYADLQVTDPSGCRSSLRKSFLNFPDFNWYYPNVFSPNGNGTNDVFKAVGGAYTLSYSLKIFNRWGEMMFETNNVMEGWDGQFQQESCAEGTYTYIAVIKTLMGETIQKRGTVILIR